MYETSPALSFWVATAALALFLILAVRDPGRAAALRTARRHAGVQVVLTVTAFLWLLGALLTIPHDGGSLLTSFLETVGAGLPEKSASLPFALSSTSGVPLEHVSPLLPSNERPFFIVTKRSLVAFIAGGVTAFAFLIVLASAIAGKTGGTFAEGVAALGRLSWRSTLATSIILWILINWLLLVWPVRHILGTDATGADRLASFVHSLPGTVPVILWVLLLMSWIWIRRSARSR